MNDLAFPDSRSLSICLSSCLSKWGRQEGFGHADRALDYTESGAESRSQNVMRTVAPQIKPSKISRVLQLLIR